MIPLLELPNEQAIMQIEGWLSPNEGRALAGLASQVPADLAIVELGSWMGRSTAFLASGSLAGSKAPVYSVDIGTGPPQAPLAPDGTCRRPTLEANIERLGVSGVVSFITALTLDVAATWSRPVGLLFIDALHELDAVRGDYLAWHGFIAVGGWIAFHDYSTVWPGPMWVVDNLVRPCPLWGEVEVVDWLAVARRVAAED